MKRKILKITALVAAIALIAGVCLLANSLLGNPISKALAKNTAQKHLDVAYANQNLTLEEVVYSFKDCYYHAKVTSPDNIDGSFTILVDMWGNLKFDTYEDRVTGGWNTADRINKDYRGRVDAVLRSQTFPYQSHIGYGDIEFISREYKDAPDVPSYALIPQDLTPGAFYDPNPFGAKAGKLTLYIDDNTVSVERLAEILLDVRRIFDDAGVRFYVIDCVLQSPRIEGSDFEEDRIEVMEFLYSDIYEEGLVDRVKASDEAAKEYYAAQDDEKLSQIEENE